MLCQSAFGPLNPSYIDLTTRQVNPVFQSKEGVTLIQWFCFTFLEQILLLWKFVFDSLGRQAGPTASTPTCPYQFLWISCPLASPLASRTSLGPLWTQFYTVWRGYLTTSFVLGRSRISWPDLTLFLISFHRRKYNSDVKRQSNTWMLIYFHVNCCP